MQHKMGENIAKEWSADGQAQELWDSLQDLESDPDLGVARLKALAEDGSTLAMMYLGHAISTGKSGVGADNKTAEYWLRKSATQSIEGSYQLARHLQRVGRRVESVEQFILLGERGYSPAMFATGWAYYKGEGVIRDKQKALHHFGMASRNGHLLSKKWINRILLEKSSGISERVKGLIGNLLLAVPFVILASKNPKTDRLRS